MGRVKFLNVGSIILLLLVFSGCRSRNIPSEIYDLRLGSGFHPSDMCSSLYNNTGISFYVSDKNDHVIKGHNTSFMNKVWSTAYFSLNFKGHLDIVTFDYSPGGMSDRSKQMVEDRYYELYWQLKELYGKPKFDSQVSCNTSWSNSKIKASLYTGIEDGSYFVSLQYNTKQP